VCVGEKATTVAKHEARTIVAAVEGAHGFVVPGVVHVWNLEATTLFNHTICAWLTGNPLPRILQPL
jgi:hypothetical protein